MNPQLKASFLAQLDRLRPLVAAARVRRFWIKLVVVTGLAILAAGTLGRSALARSATVRAEAAELAKARAGLERWRRDGILPTAAEVELWRTSEASLAGLSPEASEPLLVARRVAGRAERVGVSGLSIRMAEIDTLAEGPPLQIGRWAVEAGAVGLIVEFDSSVGKVVSFLGALPPQVEVAGVQITGSDDHLHTRVVLRLIRVVELS